MAKETLQNILTFRFFNNLFEDNWGRDLIEKINVRELENVGAEDRGPFYESVGALRDVGQNHLLEMIALVAMDQPRDMSADAIRAARAALLETIKPLSPFGDRKENIPRAVRRLSRHKRRGSEVHRGNIF